MGRYYFSKKAEVDDVKSIDMSFLKKKGYLSGFRSGTLRWTSPSGSKSSIGIDVSTARRRARLYYTQTYDDGRESDISDYIELTTTPCNFGGKRYWFICPLYKRNGGLCNRRIRVLYKGGCHFGCRHCYNITYSSRNINRAMRHRPDFLILVLNDKIDKLQSQIKTPYYAGKPTRKQSKLDKMYEKLNHISPLLTGLSGVK